MMMRGSGPGGYVMGRYNSSRGGGYGNGAVRGTRELYDPYRQLHRAGPSPVVPASILGVMFLMTATPYLRTPDMAYYGHTAVRASSFPMPLLWIPVAAVIALQFFGTSDWYHGVYVGDRYGARPGTSRWWPWSSPSPWNYPFNRYNTHQHRGLLSIFMDYGGHWFLILLGIAVFTLVSSSSLPSAPTPRVPTVPLAPRTLGFPWSWFF